MVMKRTSDTNNKKKKKVTLVIYVCLEPNIFYVFKKAYQKFNIVFPPQKDFRFVIDMYLCSEMRVCECVDITPYTSFNSGFPNPAAYCIREATKKVLFLVAGPLRGGGG